MQGTVQLEKYFAASEITVLAVCFVMLILLTVSFRKTIWLIVMVGNW